MNTKASSDSTNIFITWYVHEDFELTEKEYLHKQQEAIPGNF